MASKASETPSSREPYAQATAVNMVRPAKEAIHLYETVIPATGVTSDEPDRQPTLRSTKPSLKHLFSFVQGQQVRVLACAVATSFLVAAIKTLYAVVLGMTFEVVANFGAQTLSGDEFRSQIIRWCIYLVALGAAIMVCSGLDLGFWVISGELRAKSIREAVFSKLLRRSMHWFDSREDGMAPLITVVESQTRELQTAASQSLGLLVCDVFIFMACLAVAFFFSWQLTLVMLATVLPSAAIISLVHRKLSAAIEAQRNAASSATKRAAAAIQAIDLVKVYNAADHEHHLYLDTVREAARHHARQVFCHCAQLGYVKFWMVSLFVLGFYVAVVLVDKTSLSPGNALTTFYAVLTAFQAVEALGPQWLILAKGMAAGQALKEFASGSPDGDEVSGSHQPTMCAGDVEFSNVGFTYPSGTGQPALHPSFFFFPAGEMTFLVGRSGSGKSTIANLLVRLYNPSTGNIMLDGRKVETLDLSWLRQNVTLVQQSSTLFQDTFYQNVVFGAHDPDNVTEDAVRQACSLALLQSTIASLPDGIHTALGSGGQSLSGGQKQRLAIARARLRDAPVLILDEVTSGLDPISRTLIMEAIRLWRRGKTTIVITHEVSQIEDEDYVYVMEDGRVVQEGFRRHLVRINGLFASFGDVKNEEIVTEPPTPMSIGNDSPLEEPKTSGLNRLSQLVFGGANRLSRDFSGFGIMAGRSLIPSGDRNSISLQVLTQRSQRTSLVGPSMPIKRNSLDVITALGLDVQKTRSRNSRRGLHQEAVETAAASQDSLERFFLENLARDRKKAERTGAQVPSFIKILCTIWSTLLIARRVDLFLGLAMCVIAAASTPAFSFFFANLLEAFWHPGNRATAGSRWAGALAGIAAVDAGSTFLAYFLLARVAQAWVDSLRSQAFRRIVAQPKTWFSRARHSPDAIVECLDRNADEMRKLVALFVPICVMVLLMVTSSLAWALTIRWDLTLITLAGVPVALGAARASSAVNDKWQATCDAAAVATSSIFAETFQNVRVVRAFTLESYFTKKHSDLAQIGFRMGLKRAIRVGAFNGVYQSIAYFLTALVFYYASKIMQDRTISATEVLRVVNLIMFSLGTSTAMMSNIPQVAAAKTTAVQMLYFAHLSFDASHEEHGSHRLLSPFPIRMHHLRFAYPGQKSTHTLRNVCLSIEAGVCLAIVGASGCGKSTIAAILLGLYQPTQVKAKSLRLASPRRIFKQFENGIPMISYPMSNKGLSQTSPQGHVVGKSSNMPALSFAYISSDELHTGSLRNHMGYVSQHPFLFPTTIRKNIIYGLHESSRYRSKSSVEAACQAAGIHDFIASLPEGYETVVGDGGLQVSGGQAQRLSIARALVRRPKLLVLDEPTSALDPESVAGVRDVIRRLMATTRGQMSVVMITHSQEMMRIADRIAVVDAGVVVEMGEYDDLMRRRGVFAQLVGGGRWIHIHGPEEKKKE